METFRRNWGIYNVLYKAEQYRVKRLVIDPNSSLSNQYHNHRKESWRVMSGVVTLVLFHPDRDDKPYTIELEAGASWTIDKGCWHKASNNTNEPAEVIEIWTGDQLSEDDIVRQER